MTQTVKPDPACRLWESTEAIIEFSRWLPEVVGTESELRRIGSTGATRIYQDVTTIDVDEVVKPLRFKDADITKYRNLLTFFRRRHGRQAR